MRPRCVRRPRVQLVVTGDELLPAGQRPQGVRIVDSNSVVLRALLARHGTVHVTGSYALELMAWRDLDVYVESPEVSLGEFFTLGGEIAALLSPVRMQFLDNRGGGLDGLPSGLYWGARLGELLQGAWKIDVWAVRPETCAELIAYCDGIAARLTPRARRAILRIKSHCWRDPAYRKGFTSQDIYRAVLDYGVSDAEGFAAFLARAEDSTP